MRPLSLLALVVPFIAALAPAPATGQLQVTRPPPPTLVVTDGSFQKTLRITDLDVEARIVGHLAETSMTMTFFNDSSRVLAGDLTFPLPAGSTVSGYGLDVNGVLVDGVVVEKEEARRIFEAEVRKGVDPGLVEKVGGAAYRTRVFPIPSKGSRTVRISWISEIDIEPGSASYFLPLGFTEPIDNVHVRVEVIKGQNSKVEGTGLKGLSFESWEDREVAETRVTQALLDTPIRIVLPNRPNQPERPVAVERAPDGTVYFALHTTQSAPSAARRVVPKRVGLLWDASLSRKDADLARDLAVLQAWSASLGKASVKVDVVAFADRALPPVSFSLPSQTPAMLDHLRAVTYDGGTAMHALQDAAAAIPADLFLLFSDGIANLGSTEPPSFAAPVYAMNGAAVANHDSLRALALASGGAWLDLASTADADVVDAIGRAPFAFRSAKGEGLGESYPRIAEPVNGPFSFAGIVRGDSTQVTLVFDGAGSGKAIQAFTVKASDATDGTLLQRFWAQKKVADLAIGGKANAASMVEVGKRHGIVTPGTSLLVLERLEQYVEYEVRPPASLTQMRTQWDNTMAARSKQQKAVSQQKLDRIVQMWEERVAWWDKEFDLSPPKVMQGSGGLGASGNGSGGGGEGRGAMATESMAPDSLMDAAPAERGMRDDEDDMRPMEESSAEMEPSSRSRAAGAPEKKSKAKDSGGPESAPPPSIALRPWDPSTPYLAALKAAPAAQWQSIYLRERDLFGDSPAFFLDCSDFFAQREQPAIARRVLSNLVELDLEDPALLRVFARRLVQIGELDLAIVTFERILELRPEEPQSHRDLALALSDRGDRRSKTAPVDALTDYQAAVDALARVVMDEWDRFSEIELIALVELNDVLFRSKAIGALKVPVDKRLVQQLDMDIRVVMSWDADMTDMDLHLIEPSGEEAYYGHNRTRIGGRVSRDFTQGYGPEEYSIRKAMKGNYVVRTKFFGSSAAALQGAVTLTLDLYTDYGRPSQSHQAITIRLAENKDTFTVGEITFEGSKALKATRD